MEKEQRIRRHEVEAARLLGPTRAHIIAIALLGKLHSLGYSRDTDLKLMGLAPIFARKPVTTRAVYRGCFRIFKMLV